MYKKYTDLLTLVYEMQGSINGVSYHEIETQFRVSRRTAERMIKAILDSFLNVEVVTKRPKRWRIRRQLPTPALGIEHVIVMQQASKMFREKRMNPEYRLMNNLMDMLRANMAPDALRSVEADADILSDSEGFVIKPGPHENIDPGMVHELRHAIMACQMISFDYAGINDPEPLPRTVQPYGFLHGTRQYLIAFNPQEDVNDFRSYILAKVQNLQVHERNNFIRPENFTMAMYLEDCFGVFHEKPYNVVWRFDADVSETVLEWKFHRSQTMRTLRDGRIEVSFRAGGLTEMAWHLITWGGKVEVLKPKKLINKLREVRESIRLPD